MQAQRRRADSEAESNDENELDAMNRDEDDGESSLEDEELTPDTEMTTGQERIIDMLEGFQQQIMMEIADIKTAIQALQAGEKLLEAHVVRQHVLYFVFPQFPKASVIKVSRCTRVTVAICVK